MATWKLAAPTVSSVVCTPGISVAAKWPMNVLVGSAMSSAASFKRSSSRWTRRWNIAVWGGVGDDLDPVEGAERRRELVRARDELGHSRQDLVEAPLCGEQERVCRE
jgi:hypothetical protein